MKRLKTTHVFLCGVSSVGRLLERLLALALFMPLMFAGAWLGFEFPGIDHDTRTIFFLGWMIAMAFVVDRICTSVFREK